MIGHNAPISYSQQAFLDHFNMQPSQVNGTINSDTEYHKRYLWMQVYSVLKFKLPSEWRLNWFRFWLFHYGSIAAIYTNKYGWIAYPYGINKLDLYYQPKEIIVSSPFLDSEKVGRIGVNAEIIKITDDYFSLNDLVTRYATQLANIDKAINIALMNTNVAFVFGASNKKEADTIKEAYGNATEGNPLTVINKDILSGNKLEPFFPGVKNNYIVDLLLQAKRTVINEFLTKVGIKNANYDKKERLNSQEVNQNNDETKSIISIIYENIKESFNRLNKISGLGLEVEYAFDYDEEGGAEDGTYNTMGNDAV